jgi:hypothetical protein
MKKKRGNEKGIALDIGQKDETAEKEMLLA